LGKCATDEAEKEKIKFLLTKEGKEEYLKLVKETVTFADLFTMFPSTLTSLDYLV
jgi:hypothetical protein